MNNSVLIVDDESNVLHSLARELRKEPYLVLCAQTPQEGLDVLKNRSVSVIISDMQMPEMNGTEFIAEASKLCPHSVNMILSGHLESNLVMSAINSGFVWRYLCKPWQTDDLKVAIRNAIELFEANHERRNLLETLREKNQELQKLSASLEHKVREQTRELYNQIVLLKMILEGRDIPSIVSIMSSFLADLFQTGQIFFYVLCEDRFYQWEGPLTEERFAEWHDHIASAIAQKQLQHGKECIYQPLMSEDECYGVLIICQSPVSVVSVHEYFTGYATIAAIAMRHLRLRADSPEIISKIENILEDLK